MSLKVLTWVFDQDIKPATKKLTLIALADFANDQNECYPSVETLTNKTSLNRKTVLKNVAELVADGVIADTGKRVGNTQQVKIYRININSPKNGTVPKTEQSQICQSNSPNFTMKESQKRDTEPLGNHQIEPSASTKPPEAGTEKPALPPEAVIWNEVCTSLPKVLHVGPSRLQSLRSRRKETFWRENFAAACSKVSDSDFCRGEGSTKWQATFDWMLRPDTVPRVMEGKYDNRKGSAAAKPSDPWKDLEV